MEEINIVLIRDVQQFLWGLGGFDRKALAREDCRAIRPKYCALGVLVLVTALLATCSGWYALLTIFGNVWIACLISLVWGTMIFFLDRLLVSSTRKIANLKEYYTGVHSVPPFEPKNPWFALAVRVALACAIGLVVSKPLEVRLLRPWIDRHEREIERENLARVENNPALERLRIEIAAIEESQKVKDQEVREKRIDAAGEADGTRGTQKRNEGPIYKLKEGYYQSAKAEADKIAIELEKKQREYKDIDTRLEADAARDNSARDKEQSIISDLGIIHELAAANNGNAAIVSAVSWALTLLFVLIESVPVLAKALSSFDTYDAVLQNEEHGAILDLLGSANNKHREVMDTVESPITSSARAGSR